MASVVLFHYTNLAKLYKNYKNYQYNRVIYLDESLPLTLT